MNFEPIIKKNLMVNRKISKKKKKIFTWKEYSQITVPSDKLFEKKKKKKKKKENSFHFRSVFLGRIPFHAKENVLGHPVIIFSLTSLKQRCTSVWILSNFLPYRGWFYSICIRGYILGDKSTCYVCYATFTNSLKFKTIRERIADLL